METRPSEPDRDPARFRGIMPPVAIIPSASQTPPYLDPSQVLSFYGAK